MSKICSKNTRDQYLRVQLIDQFLLIELKYIELVLPLPALQNTSSANPALIGILNYHGENIPVYSLATLVFHTHQILSIDAPLILCEVQQSRIALLASQADEIVHILPQHIQNAAKLQSSPYIKGLTQHNVERAWLLDIERVFLDMAHEIKWGIDDIA